MSNGDERAGSEPNSGGPCPSSLALDKLRLPLAHARRQLDSRIVTRPYKSGRVLQCDRRHGRLP